MKLKLQTSLLAVFGAVIVLTGCTEKSNSTGWKYNNTENGGFEKPSFYEQQALLDLYSLRVVPSLWVKLRMI